MHVFVHVGIIIEGAARARCRRGAAEAKKIIITRVVGLWLSLADPDGFSARRGRFHSKTSF